MLFNPQSRKNDRLHVARASRPRRKDERVIAGETPASRRVQAAFLFAASFAVATLVGCQSAHVAQPLTSTISTTDTDQQSEFFDQLSRRPVTSNDDAFHALILYIDGTDACADYPARVQLLKNKKVLSPSFNAPANDAVTRGDLAVAIVNIAHIHGGLTSTLIGPTPRYATRTLQSNGLYPESSPNMTFSGAEFCGILGKLEDSQRGNPNRAPAEFLPGEIGVKTVVMTDKSVDDVVTANTPEPLLLMQNAPASAPTAPVSLSVIITGVEGPLAQARADENSPWQKATVGMKLTEKAEFRTGIRSAIRFVIPPDQTFTLDRLGTTKVLQAVYDGQKIKTDVAMQTGRVRLDVAPMGAASKKVLADANETNPYQIEEAGVRHDSTIRSPNSALAVRGTKVSLYDQPPFTPEAVSLTGRAQFENTRRQVIAFGGVGRYSQVAGDQTSSADAGLEESTSLQRSTAVSLTDFNNHLINFTVAHGGFVKGDVVVGNSQLPEPQLIAALPPNTIDFVLKWNGGPSQALNDLNLFAISPASTPQKVDFVANPPFTFSLAPDDPANIAKRAEFYPRTSPAGGAISKNSVGPEGLELASFPDTLKGTYTVGAFNLVDPLPSNPKPPLQDSKFVPYTIDVYIDGKLQKNLSIKSKVGFLNISPNAITIPGGNTPAVARAVPRSLPATALPMIKR